MKICAAQIQPLKKDIDKNIKNHLAFIELASSDKVDIIIFPELSLTGYEPTLAKELAIGIDDKRLDIFQQVSNKKKMTIGAGIPLKNDSGVTISMVLFQPDSPRELYSKKYLHTDEKPFFVGGENYTGPLNKQNNIALAICYELSITEHAENAYIRGSKLYIASVAKSADGLKNASSRLSEIARKYSMSALMANSVGFCDNFKSDGQSAAWNNHGELLEKLDSENQGILILDTTTGKTFKKSIISL